MRLYAYVADIEEQYNIELESTREQNRRVCFSPFMLQWYEHNKKTKY